MNTDIFIFNVRNLVYVPTQTIKIKLFTSIYKDYITTYLACHTGTYLNEGNSKTENSRFGQQETCKSVNISKEMEGAEAEASSVIMLIMLN